MYIMPLTTYNYNIDAQIYLGQLYYLQSQLELIRRPKFIDDILHLRLSLPC